MHHVQTPDFCEKIGLETTEFENFSPRSPIKTSLCCILKGSIRSSGFLSYLYDTDSIPTIIVINIVA